MEKLEKKIKIEKEKEPKVELKYLRIIPTVLFLLVIELREKLKQSVQVL